MTQQHGYVTRAFGPVKAVTIPSASSAAERVVEVSMPDRASEMGGLWFTSLLKHGGFQWRMLGDASNYGNSTQDTGGVYRLLVGKAAIAPWVDLPMTVMGNRIGYWPGTNRVVGVVGHPDALLHPGIQKRERVHAAMEFILDWSRVVAGDVSALDFMALDCIKCADDGVPMTYVTEIDRNGLGLCRRHSGFDVRPEGQRWQQGKLL